MRIAGYGYEQEPLIDGAAFLDDPLFWPTYLSSMVTPEDDSLVTEAFGVKADDCYEYYARRLRDPDAWPVFQLGLRDGHEVNVVYFNVPREYFCDFLLCRPGGEHALRLATVGGHEMRPGLSWPELGTAAGFSGASLGVVAPNARLLLLLPALGDRDVPTEATARVAAALTSCGAGAKVDELAAHLLESLPRPPWRNVDGVRVSDGRYSMRNPDGGAGLSPADLREISTALAEIS
ncbi:hypothetical protein ACIQH6_19605 [Micromonospora orduensis]|uniref:hypothetical protein n=1 Tax=Micromonospora orduensis TaxID=1420891 RepID=UPI0037F4883F